MRTLWAYIVVIIALHIAVQGVAQVRVTGGFLSDSLKIGEETAFYLTARYPSASTILFPDSSADYSPFEFTKKRYFTTVSSDGISRDSAVFHLTTFEIDSVQVLQLPAYLLNATDCTTYMSNADSVRLIHVVKEMSDSVAIADLPLKEHTAYQPVSLAVNYVIVLAVTAVVIVACLVVWMFFGKRIRRYFTARRLRLRHKHFMVTYEQIVRDVEKAYTPAQTETALAAWKRYMEQLESRPYTKLTTAETIRLYRDETLGGNLRKIDRSIYGHDQDVIPALQQLKAIAGNRFEHKLQEVMHGK